MALAKLPSTDPGSRARDSWASRILNYRRASKAALLEKYVTALRFQGRAETTIHQYVMWLTRMERHLGKPFTQTPRAYLTAADVWNFLEANAALSPISIQCAVSAAKSWHKWGNSHELWKLNGIVSIQVPTGEREPGKPLEVHQVAWLLAHADTPERKRAILPAAWAGFRIHECALIDEEIWSEPDRLKILGKGRKRGGRPDEVPVARALAQERDAILSCRPSYRQLRVVVERMQELAQMFGEFSWRHQQLRTTYSQRLMDQGERVEVVEKLMRHKPQSTTLKHYGQVPWEPQVQAIDRLHYGAGQMSLLGGAEASS